MKRAIVNAKVYIESGRFASAVLWENGRILKTGDDSLAAEADEVIDAAGKTLLPGFNDSHLHLSMVAEQLAQPIIDDVTSIDQMVEMVRDFRQKHPEYTLHGIQATGWNQDKFKGDKRLPEAKDLDRIATDIPVLLERVCGHIAACNTKALEMLKSAGPVPDGGVLECDAQGRPNGIFTENAVGWA